MTEQEEKDRHHKHHPNGSHKHFCLEFDGMYICDLCPEFEVCLCYSGECDICQGRAWVWMSITGSNQKMPCQRCEPSDEERNLTK